MLNKKIVLLMAVMLVMGSMSVFAEESYGAVASFAVESYDLEDMLAYAYQDEMLAQGEYDALLSEFASVRVFENIKKAEEKHITYVEGLYDYHELTLPEFDTEGLTAVPATLEEAYQIGVDAEINNIKMYEAFLEKDLDDYTRTVFTALKDASVNHLNAFERQVSRNTDGVKSGNGRYGSNGKGNGKRK